MRDTGDVGDLRNFDWYQLVALLGGTTVHVRARSRAEAQRLGAEVLAGDFTIALLAPASAAASEALRAVR